MGSPPDQREVAAFLSQPGAYGLPPGSPIERIETHISMVWLAGSRAYKLKRAVKYDYVDFSTVESRRTSCERELHLNRRTAPHLYLGVRPITREKGGSLALGGTGQPVDWVVEMQRFEQGALLDRLAERGVLDIGAMDALADQIADLHAQAERRQDLGGREGMAWVIDGNASAFETDLNAADRATGRQVIKAARAALEGSGPLLDARRDLGFVRWCHGDLHLGNLVLLDGAPTLFDAVEFNERIACVDVLYDLAFLLMDLWHRGLSRHANAVFNAYVARTGDLGGLSLLPLFLSSRAAVRAKTSAESAAVQPDVARTNELAEAACAYLRLAEQLIHPPPARLIAIGGLSGSGKSTLAHALAPLLGGAPGALVLRSDVIRKHQHGAAPLTRLPPEGYSEVATARVYHAMAETARTVLSAGHSVIVDAVHLSEEQRLQIATAAREAAVPFVGLWLDAPEAALRRRLRVRGADASDATEDVLARQRDTARGLLDWHVLDASSTADALLVRAIGLVGARGLSPAGRGRMRTG